jgi:hypothetical protein
MRREVIPTAVLMAMLHATGSAFYDHEHSARGMIQKSKMSMRLTPGGESAASLATQVKVLQPHQRLADVRLKVHQS